MLTDPQYGMYNLDAFNKEYDPQKLYDWLLTTNEWASHTIIDMGYDDTPDDIVIEISFLVPKDSIFTEQIRKELKKLGLKIRDDYSFNSGYGLISVGNENTGRSVSPDWYDGLELILDENVESV